MNSIEIKDISKAYGGFPALFKSTLSIEYGKIYGLLGRNGAGKTTLLKLINHHIFADEGEIIIDGEALSEHPEVTQKLFFVGEDNLYPDSFRVLDVFKCTQRFYPTFDYEKALKLSDAFSLNTKKRLKALSTGYRTIYKLIIALCVNTPYVFLDEPVLGLDANHRILFYKMLMESYAEQSNTYVLSTHLIDEISGLIEDVIILKQGNVLIQANTEKFVEMGYTVSGASADVDQYLVDKSPLSTEQIGSLKIAYLIDSGVNRNIPDALQYAKLDLQHLFVALTNH